MTAAPTTPAAGDGGGSASPTAGQTDLAPRSTQRAVCPVCHGAGGWQQPDGAINECPRGCATGGDAA